MIAQLRRRLTFRRRRPPTTAELTQAWLATQLTRPRPDPEATAYLGPFGDPAQDGIGTNRWRASDDPYAWVKTGPDRWVDIGGYSVRSDAEVLAFLPGTMRTHRPPRPEPL